MKTLSKIQSLIKRYQKLITGSFKVLLFAICLTYVLVLGIQCFKKYFSCQQSTEISFELASEHEFPSFTFCPLEENQEQDLYFPKPFDEDRLIGNFEQEMIKSKELKLFFVPKNVD